MKKLLIFLTLITLMFLNINLKDLLKVNIVNAQGFSIQEEINKAEPGTTITIPKGNYLIQEYPILVNKTLTIIGEDPAETIISGNNETTALIIIKSNDVILKNLTLKDTNPQAGIALQLINVRNVTIQNCNILNSWLGIEISNSSANKILLCNITQTTRALHIYQNSQANEIFYNNIIQNIQGVDIDQQAKRNYIYNNNFENQYNIQGLGVSFNYWNLTYAVGGNYWKNYNGKDNKNGPFQNQTGSDGIGDEPYQTPEHGEIDFYPYINRLEVKVYKWIDKSEYYTVISTNVTKVLNFTFNPNEKAISLTTNQQATSYYRIIIPKKLLSAEENTWEITSDQERINYLEFHDNEFTCIYFVLISPPKETQITIRGSLAIPEKVNIFFIALILIVIITCQMRKKA